MCSKPLISDGTTQSCGACVLTFHHIIVFCIHYGCPAVFSEVVSFVMRVQICFILSWLPGVWNISSLHEMKHSAKSNTAAGTCLYVRVVVVDDVGTHAHSFPFHSSLLCCHSYDVQHRSYPSPSTMPFFISILEPFSTGVYEGGPLYGRSIARLTRLLRLLFAFATWIGLSA